MMREKVDNYWANKPAMDPARVRTYVANQVGILNDFATLAGVKPPVDGGEWRPVIDAGITYVDQQCDQFMDSLFWLNRARETASRQVQYTGAALGAALAAVEASKNAIGLTPLGFSLVDQTINNLGAGLLFNLNPSTVRTLVEKRQVAYLQSLSPSYTSKALALRMIQGYAAICLPPSIETEVERAIDAKEYTPHKIAPDLPPAYDDVKPDDFAFTEATDVTADTLIESDAVTVTGIGSPASISISAGGKYRIGDDGKWTGATGKVGPRQSVRVQVRSAATGAPPVSTTLTIGGVPATFKVTTAAAAPAALVEGAPAPVKGAVAPAVESKARPSSPEANAVPNPL